MGIGTKIAQMVASQTLGWLNPTQWDDRSSSSTRVRIGALSKPDFDYTNIGLLFPQNDPAEKVYIGDQMLHRKKLGTVLHLHMHFVQTSSDLPTFKADYRFYNNGGTIPAFTTISTDDGEGAAFTYPGSGSILQIVEFPYLTPPDPENVSANLDLIVYRDDNLITGDVLVKFIDYHFESDSLGSRQEYIK